MSWAEESADPSQVDRRNIILLVDDAPENLRILSECLRDKYTIMFAKNGTDALRLALRQPPPDLILLDVIMPGMDGYEVCKRLRSADPRHPGYVHYGAE